MSAHSLKSYEIHYLHDGLKKVALIQRLSMTEFDSWRIATLYGGACLGELASIDTLAKMQAQAALRGIHSVRWNVAIHFRSWARPVEIFQDAPQRVHTLRPNSAPRQRELISLRESA